MISGWVRNLSNKDIQLNKSEILFKWTEPKYESCYKLGDTKFYLSSLSIFLFFSSFLAIGGIWFFVFNQLFPTALDPSLPNIKLLFSCFLFALPISVYQAPHLLCVIPYLLKKLDLKTETNFQITLTNLECRSLLTLGTESLAISKMNGFGFARMTEADRVLELWVVVKEEEEEEKTMRIGGIEQAQADELKAILQNQIGLPYIEKNTNVTCCG